MERNNWVESPVPVTTRAHRALHLVAQPARAVLGSDMGVEALLSGRPIRDVLVVDPSSELRRGVQDILGSVATVHACSGFEEACSRLISNPPDLLVTSVRLHAHNGLHLVYLAARNPRTRSIVYLTYEDFALARDAEAAGAFVVCEPSLNAVIESIVMAILRRSDRRDGPLMPGRAAAER